jgi:glucokinase
VDDVPRAASRHLGLDLGGTFIKWIVLEHADGDWNPVERGQVGTNGRAGPDAVVASLALVAVSAQERHPGIYSVGIGVPGSYDPAAGATRFLTNVPGDWDGKPVARLVGGELGLPTFLINDARAFGLAELRMGAGRGASSMVGIALGTGVGGVIAIDGRIHYGHEGSAGELGHQVVEPDGPDCSCGGRGCLEVFVRADRIEADAGAATVAEAVARARAGDARAMAAITAAGRYLGIGIANMVAVFTPDRIVIGGGVSASLDLFIDTIWEELRRRVHLTPLDKVEIVAAELGVWAGAIGAALHGAESAAPRP